MFLYVDSIIAGILAFDPSSDGLIVEQGSNITITVRRSAGLFGSVTVAYTITGPVAGSCLKDSLSGVFTFGPGDSTSTATLICIQTSAPLDVAMFTGSLTNPTGGAV